RSAVGGWVGPQGLVRKSLMRVASRSGCSSISRCPVAGSSSRPTVPGMSAQPLGPLRAEVRVVAAPDDQGGVGEAAQSRDRGGGAPLVGGVELAGEEAPGLGAAMPVGEVGLQVAVEEFAGEHAGVVDGPAGAQDEFE